MKILYNSKRIEKITKHHTYPYIKYVEGNIIYEKNLKKIFIALKSLPKKEENYDLVISLKTTNNENSKKYNFYIDEKMLTKQGNYYIYLNRNKIKYVTSRDIYGYRSWLPL